MANKTWKDATFRMDNSTGSLVAITSFINQFDLQRAINLLDDTALGDTNRSVLTGLAGTTISINGFVNTTTDGLFGPMIATAPTATRTVELLSYTGRYYNGEVLFSNVQYSGSVDNLQTLSADMTFDGAVNRTSAAL